MLIYVKPTLETWENKDLTIFASCQYGSLTITFRQTAMLEKSYDHLNNESANIVSLKNGLTKLS